jgi:hypothetical protein
MSREAMHEIRPISSNGHKDQRPFVAKNRNGGMPIIRCVCGAEILLVPDVKEMNRAIDSHVYKHVKIAHRNEDTFPPEGVRRILVEQILEKASEVSL